MRTGNTFLTKPIKQIENWWHHVGEGWWELRHMASRAMTPFTHSSVSDSNGTGEGTHSVRWSLVPLELQEDKTDLVIHLEIPGLNKQDISVEVLHQQLRIRGEKTVEHESSARQIHVVERAYGRFERIVPLPVAVEASQAKASYKRGVLTVVLPKTHVHENHDDITIQ